VTIARRICAVVDVDARGRARVTPRDVDTDDAVHIAQALVHAGADELWLRALPSVVTSPPGLDASSVPALIEAVRALRDRIFVPLVAWAPVDSASDAKLLIDLGADRVVVERLGDDPVLHLRSLVEVVGPDRVSVALHVRRVAAEKGVAWELLDEDGTGTGRDAIDLIQQLPDAGAAEVVLVPTARSEEGFVSPGVVHDGDLVEAVASSLWIPVVSVGEDRSPDDMAPALLMGADGVACMGLWGAGTTALDVVKRALNAYGIPVRLA
jgi:cyclase